MVDRLRLREKKRVVIKVGTSNLTFPNGKINFGRIEHLVRVISDIQNSGKKVLLVSSGAIAVGCGLLGRENRPDTIEGKQAMAAIGQAELMRIYNKFFSEYQQFIAQILLTRDEVINEKKNLNARNTLNTLLKMNVIPIINENDTVATEEIEYGDNDRLSADLACLADAGVLIILSDIHGLYNADPREDSNAEIIPKVVNITPEIELMAGGSKNSFAKGGMTTKIAAARICFENGIDTVICNGENPEILMEVLDGKDIGTLFVAPKK